MTHELKCLPDQWHAYKSGIKNNSIRFNDRNFQVNDLVVLRLWKDDRFILNEIAIRKITHVLHDFEFIKIPKGYCIISLKDNL